MKRFYSNNIQNNFIYLENEEAQHCTKVLRGKIGDKVEVLNGNGKLFIGELTNIQKHEVQIEIIQILKEEKENVYGMYDKANIKYIIDILKVINPKIGIITNTAYSVHMDLIDLIYSILNTKDNIQEVIVKRTGTKLLSKFNKFK